MISCRRAVWCSDVWAFGVLLWEMASFARTPYGACNAEEITRDVQGGFRLPQPAQCDAEFYKLMRT